MSARKYYTMENEDDATEAALEAAADVALKAAFEVVDKVESGVLTREQAKEELIKLGARPRWAARFLMHTLDQEELDRIRRETGRIID